MEQSKKWRSKSACIASIDWLENGRKETPLGHHSTARGRICTGCCLKGLYLMSSTMSKYQEWYIFSKNVSVCFFQPWRVLTQIFTNMNSSKTMCILTLNLALNLDNYECEITNFAYACFLTWKMHSKCIHLLPCSHH